MRKLLKKYLKLSLKYRDSRGAMDDMAPSIYMTRLAREARIDILEVFGYMIVLDRKACALKLEQLPLKEEYRACIRLIEDICKDCKA